jgi:sarcosine oxidase subunit alpha
LRTESGGRVDRARPLRFTFDGRPFEGLHGDTLASALLANGVHLVSRSFKYHRPRGILTAGAEEPSALVAIRRDAARYTPNLRATQVELYEGLCAESQNRWPSLRFDFGRANDWLSAFFPAGFYYKTFMWPRAAWKTLYEPAIRSAAGLGRAPNRADTDRYARCYAHCDVLIVGAGPTGLAAALCAASSGARVILCDEQSELGGSLLAGSAAVIDGVAADAWLAQTLATLASHPRVLLLPRTTAFGYFPHNAIGLNERLTDHLASPYPGQARERLWQVRAREVVLATGAIERPLVFPGNDRPGIMLAAAAHTYLNRYGVLAGSRAVVVTATDAAYQTAIDMHQAGVAVAAIADVRVRADGVLPQAARRADIEIITGATVFGTAGICASTPSRSEPSMALAVTRGRQRIACDLVLMSGGFTPSVHLFSQSRGKLAWSDGLQAFLPASSAERERSAGACRGLHGLSAVLEDGAAAGTMAAQAAGYDPVVRRFAVSAGDDGVSAAPSVLAHCAADRRLEGLRGLAERRHRR